MADKDLQQGQSLNNADKTRFIEIEAGVYAQLVATADGGIVPASAALTLSSTPISVNGDTLVLAANADRRYLLLTNDSDTVIYARLATGAAAVNQWIRLNASGGSYEMSAATGIYRGVIRANHGGGAVNKTLLVVEGV